jgi:hypothetical protein
MRCARGASVLPWRRLPANRVRGPSRIPRPAPATLERPEVVVRPLDEPEDRVGVLEQERACFGQRDGPPSFRTLDQPVTDALLEDRDLLTDRRLREAEPRRGGAERPFSFDRAQRCEMSELDAGPATEPIGGIRSVLRARGGQPPVCFPPTWVSPMIVEPAMERG